MKKKIFWIIFLMLTVVIVLFVLLPNTFKINVIHNAANALWALAVCGGIIIIYLIVKHIFEPKLLVVVNIKAELKDPIPLFRKLGLMRTTFKIETSYQIRHKRNPSFEIMPGEKFVIKYDKKEYPDLHNWCMIQMKEAQTRALENAKYLFPDAKIILRKLPKPEEIKAISS